MALATQGTAYREWLFGYKVGKPIDGTRARNNSINVHLL
jgi:hypothetical protein